VKVKSIGKKVNYISDLSCPTSSGLTA